MRMDEPQAGKARTGPTLTLEGRDNQGFLITNDHRGNAALTVHQDADLTVEVVGDFRELTGQFGANNPPGLDLATIQFLQAAQLLGLEANQIT